ncbi:MAG: GNAT family N-acetyltransferase, partial [Anaerolineales bacterium]|nr:GNAT family N-acetyltransferase [Anaerolineales bacterium]
ETKRLLLRQFNEEDLDQFSEICADPAVMRYASFTGEPRTGAQAWSWICNMVGHWQLRGYGMWAVEEKKSRRLIGRIGIHYPEGFPDIEVGWMLGKLYWGKGYATEGASAAIEFGFRELKRDSFISLIVPDNKRSIRLAERLGEEFEEEIELQGHLLLLYRIHKSKWISRPK